MAAALVASVTRTAAGTTAAIDTTGATLLVVSAGAWTAAPTISDSKGNTWFGLPNRVGSSGNARLFYCLTPTVGSGHTFTLVGSYSSCVVYAFSGVFSFQIESGAGVASNSPPVACGSMTPLSDGALIVTGIASNSAATDAVSPGSFTQTTIPNGAGVNLQHSAAWLVQTTAAPINPTWTWSAGSHDYAAVSAAVFLLDPPLPVAVRVTQGVVEVLSLPILPAARVSQAVVETLSSHLVAPVRLTQDVVEVLSARVAPGAITLIATVTAPMNVNGSTTAPIDTTGADLLVLSVGWWAGGGTLTAPSDNKGNTWWARTSHGPGEYATHRFWYAKNPTVGPGHTFTAVGTGTYATQIVHAFKGADLTNPYVIESGTSSFPGGSPLASGSVTPAQHGSAIVAAWAQMTSPGNNNLTLTPVMEMTVTQAGGYDAVATGVLLQPVAAPVNPTWAWTGAAGVAVSTVVFRPADAPVLTVAVSETLTVIDVIPAQPLTPSRFETVGVVERVTVVLRDRFMLQAESETFTVLDVVMAVMAMGTAPAEDVLITEDVQPRVLSVLRGTPFETLTLTEGLTRVSYDAAKATPADTLTVTDTATAQLVLTISRAVADTIGQAEQVTTILRPLVVRVSDTVSVVGLTSLPIGAPLITEVIRVTDMLVLYSPALAIQVADAITVSEPYMNHNTVGLGPNPTPLPGATLRDFWKVGIA